MNKHSEHSHTISPSGKYVFCYQRVYCGREDYFVVKTTDDFQGAESVTEDSRVIYALCHDNGYTDWPYGSIRWETENGEDILVDDRIYLFYERDGLLALMNGDEASKGGNVDEIMNDCFKTTPRFWKDEIHLDHRIVKYKHLPATNGETTVIPEVYHPQGREVKYNLELKVVDDQPGEFFKRWRNQEKCLIYKECDWSNPGHSRHQNYLEDKSKYDWINLEWHVTEESWSEVRRYNKNLYY